MGIHVSKDFKIDKCYKIKNLKMTKIPNSVCKSEKKINKLLDKGFVVSRSGEQKTNEGHKTVIESFSPRAREPEGNWIRKLYSEGAIGNEDEFED